MFLLQSYQTHGGSPHLYHPSCLWEEREKEREEGEEREREGREGEGDEEREREEVKPTACKVHCKMNSLTNDVCDLVPRLSILLYQLCTNTPPCADLRDHVRSCEIM